MSVSMEAVFRQPALICDDALDKEAGRGKLSRLCLYALCGSAFYGFTMGLNHPQHPMLQAMASAVKVPLLFLLTLTITLPTLHFTSLLFGSPLRFRHSLLV